MLQVAAESHPSRSEPTPVRKSQRHAIWVSDRMSHPPSITNYGYTSTIQVHPCTPLEMRDNTLRSKDPVITKPEEHETNRAGKRVLRSKLEPLGWVINDVQEDYGVDSNVQVFDRGSPTGAWFHVQLKSSASSEYSVDRKFISQDLSTAHALHYAHEMHLPVFLIHADVMTHDAYWYAPQLDLELAAKLEKSSTKSVTVRIPTCQALPNTAHQLLTSLDQIHLVLANRRLASTSVQSFAESLKHLPNQEEMTRAFQDKNDALKLKRINDLFEKRALDQARPRTEAILSDPDSTVEAKFWARLQLEAIDYFETSRSGKSSHEQPKVLLAHAKALQELTAQGPNYLKFYALIARHAAELDVLVYENLSLTMTLRQHLQQGSPMMVLGLYAKRTAVTKRLIVKYNQCLRLSRYASTYPHRWALGRALPAIVNAIAKYLITLRSEGNREAERVFAQSALQVCKLAAWIGEETGDTNAVELAIMSALMTVESEDSQAYRWAEQLAHDFRDLEIRADAHRRIERARRRWKGEVVEGDYQWDNAWQIVQNMAAALGIDVSDENAPLVRGLRIAAKDDSPQRVLHNCEHLLVSIGAVGPVARKIQRLFNLDAAGSKVVHCTLHDYHLERRELDEAYETFRRSRCDMCQDKKPRPTGWEYTDEVKQEIETRHSEFVAKLEGTMNGLRSTDTD